MTSTPLAGSSSRLIYLFRISFRIAAALAIVGLLHGCCRHSTTIATIGGKEVGEQLDRAPTAERIKALSAEIRMLSPNISPREAADCASRAINYTTLLTTTYGLTGNGEFNSLMVNIGVKRRGQCFQLADDLKAELVEQKYKTLSFTRVIAHRDSFFREHNCIVVTGPGQSFEKGLVLDPWRNPGVLRWARVELDVYPWVLRSTPNPGAPAAPSSHGNSVAERASKPPAKASPAATSAPARGVAIR